MFKFNDANGTATVMIQDYRTCQSPLALSSVSSAAHPFSSIPLLPFGSFHGTTAFLPWAAWHIICSDKVLEYQEKKTNIKKKKPDGGEKYVYYFNSSLAIVSHHQFVFPLTLTEKIQTLDQTKMPLFPL